MEEKMTFEQALNRLEEIVEKLKLGDPAIYTREYRMNNGIIEFDVRAVNEEEIQLIYERMKEIIDNK